MDALAPLAICRRRPVALAAPPECPRLRGAGDEQCGGHEASDCRVDIPLSAGLPVRSTAAGAAARVGNGDVAPTGDALCSRRTSRCLLSGSNGHAAAHSI
jgi:hypothetical protein